MSSYLDHSDSDSNNSNSWILLDDDKANNDEEEEEKEVEEEEEEEEEIAPRKTIQEVNEDSDGISIISDPEDLTAESTETKEYETNTESAKGKELVSLDAKPAKGGGSVTSALFMIAGLLIALYFQTSCQDEKAPATNTQYLGSAKSGNLFYETSKFKSLNDAHYTKGKKEEENVSKKTYKAGERKPYYEEHGKYEKGIKDKYFKKRNKYDSSEEDKYNKYYDSRESNYKYSKDHEDYLMKKQHYLKHKEEKLKQKEFKMYSKNARQHRSDEDRHYKNEKYKKYDRSGSGEWYQKMYKGRDDIRSNEHKSDWIFDRAQMRSRKRDKARWYFNWMDHRQDVRY